MPQNSDFQTATQTKEARKINFLKKIAKSYYQLPRVPYTLLNLCEYIFINKKITALQTTLFSRSQFQVKYLYVKEMGMDAQNFILRFSTPIFFRGVSAGCILRHTSCVYSLSKIIKSVPADIFTRP